MLAVAEDDHAVDDHVAHAHGVLVRLLEGRAVGDRARVEDDHVGEHAGPEEAALLELEVGRRQAAQPVDRLGEGQGLLLAHVLAEDTREVAVGARVRGRLRERRLRRHRRGVRSERHPGQPDLRVRFSSDIMK